MGTAVVTCRLVAVGTRTMRSPSSFTDLPELVWMLFGDRFPDELGNVDYEVRVFSVGSSGARTSPTQTHTTSLRRR